MRTGSLIESEQETEKSNIQEMLVSVTQMIGNVSDQNKQAFESIIMQLVLRMCELSNIDISAGISSTMNEQLMMAALESTMNAVADQQGQIGQMQQMMGMAPQGMPPEAMGQPPTPSESGAPMPPESPEFAENPQIPPEQGALPPETPMPPVEAGGMPQDMMPTMGEEMPMEEPMV